jgi:transaldolase/glucose-6-phosphate isomerase
MSVAQRNERLAALTAAGVSVWLDQIRRGMIESGELAEMVEVDSLRGVTSNPAIFEKAILGSSDYDEVIEEGVREGLGAEEIYERIAIGDVQMACDVLRGVHDETGGKDGFVSLEVAPGLAHDTEGTIAQAREYWGRVDRPNLMIKVPGTDAGLPAIEQLLFEGLNVNVTLLFAVAQYEKVMEAYIRAMERRAEAGEPLDRGSVASFFVSRVDTEVDKRVEAIGRTDLEGRAGLANARAAYHAFLRVFRGERFRALAEAGCPVQRPLWASTGVKNPAYPETMYVYGLVGKDTVNTMPLNTLVASGKQGEVTGETAALDPTDDLRALAEAGIDLADVTEQLLREGIEAFVKPFDKLLAALETKREALATGRPPSVEADLSDDLEQPVADRLRRAQDEDIVARIWHRDPTVWAPEGTPEVANRLGWLSIAETMQGEAEALKVFAAKVREEGLTDAVLLGMGGSSLAPEVFRQSFAGSADGLRLHVLDSTHPAQVRAVEQAIDPEKTLFLVSTKSGGTIETLSLFKHFWALRPDGNHFAAITDPGSSLLDLAKEHGFRRAFENDPEIGGRYSALSLFGLVPAALMGVDIDAILESALVGMQSEAGLWLGCACGELALRGRDKLTFIVDAPLESVGLWLEQLIAESTGKEGKGIVPIAGEPLVDPATYGPDRVFVHIRNEQSPNTEHTAAIGALAQAGHPVFTLHLDGPNELGRAFFVAEFATAVAGWVLGINPFDQPDVQAAKDATSRALRGELSVPEDDGELGDMAPPQYLAVLAYLPYDERTDQAVERLRRRVMERHHVATTFGYGPRYLHSTGQLHKGGPPAGVFLEIVDDGDEDVEIPGESSGFRRLIQAQADGDFATLRSRGLTAVRVRVPAGDPAAAIDRLVT